MMNSSGLTGPQEEAMATEGKYFEAYETLGPIGRGAFGFVKLAKRREDSLLVRERCAMLCACTCSHVQTVYKYSRIIHVQ